MRFFDASAWIGSWPFAFLESHSAPTLAKHLGRHRIRRALVSQLGAVFAPAPDPANAALLRDTRRFKHFVPVPVINPALGNWRDELDRCAGDSRVRVVRVLPNYHNYRLAAHGVTELATELQRRGLGLIVQTRLIDERHEWHGLNLKPVPTADLVMFLQRHPELRVLAGGLGRPDIIKLLPVHSNLIADLTFAEWHDTLTHLLAKVSARQLVFASHAPFHITAASKAKVEGQDAGRKDLRAIAEGNLATFVRRT